MKEDFYGFKAQVAKYFDQFCIPYSLVRTEHDLQEALPQNGIVLIHAAWSGYSIGNMFRILKAIQERGSPFPELVLADIDGLPPETMIRLLGRPAQGYAEGVVLLDGAVVAVHSRSAELEPFLAAISRFRH